MTRYFDKAPLLEAARHFDGSAYKVLTAQEYRSLYPKRYVSRRGVELSSHRVTAAVADRIACKLGLHPSEIWPAWFSDEP